MTNKRESVFPHKDRRLYTRFDSKFDLYIYYSSKLIGHAVLKNISMGGLLFCAEELGLTVGSLIEVEFNLPDDHPLSKLKFSAMVQRIELDNCIAVMFESVDSRISELLLDYYASKLDG